MQKFKGKFRFVGICLVVSLLLSLITACGATKTTQEESTPSGETTTQTEETSVPATLEEIALYTGADRQEKLIEAAKKEGELNLYTSSVLPDTQKIAAAFEEKYGIKVNIWRAGSEDVLQRIISEAKAGKHTFDTVDTNATELEAIRREGIFQKVESPFHADLIPSAVPDHKEWVGSKVSVFTQAYNTKLIKEEELPKTWEDLLDPKWKGKLSVEAGDFDWFAGVISGMGEDKVQLFKEIVAANDISVRDGHTLLAELVASGEVPFALTIYNYKGESMKNEGAPINWFYIGDAAIGRFNGSAVSKNALHPNAAILFYDFMINEAQNLLIDMDYVPTSEKVKTTLNDMPIEIVDPGMLLDGHAKWKGLFEEVFIDKK